MLFARLLVRPRPARLGMIAAAALAVSACTDPTSVVEDVTANQPVLNLLIATGDASLPSGTSALSGIRINNFDFSVPDAFDRATGPAGLYGVVPYNGGNYYGIDARTSFRNATTDPRLPRLTSSTATPGSWFGLFPPIFSGQGAGAWDLWGLATNLKPETPYTVVMARMALQVNGAMDQTQRLTGFNVSAPDSLYFLGGTPAAGLAAVTCNFSAFSSFTGDQNPVVLGQRTSNADGAAEVDCVARATGNSPWFRNAGDPLPAAYTDSLPSGSNTETGSVAPGMYNYILLYEGAVAPGDVSIFDRAPAARIQIGPDIDANGNIINNGYAPFPTAITNTATFKSLPGGANAFAAPSRITLDVSNLPVLGSSRYQVFLFSEATNSYQAVPVTIVVDGETVAEGAATFQSAGDDAQMRLVIDASDDIDFGSFNSVVVSIEPAAGSATPSTGQFLYREYLSTEQALSAGALSLGSFADETRFGLAGGGRASFFGDSLLVTLTRLPAPPAGFQYGSYLVRMRGPVVEETQRLHTITLDELGNGVDRISEAEALNAWENFNTYMLVLEPVSDPSFNLLRVFVSENYVDKFSDYFTTE